MHATVFHSSYAVLKRGMTVYRYIYRFFCISVFLISGNPVRNPVITFHFLWDLWIYTFQVYLLELDKRFRNEFSNIIASERQKNQLLEKHPNDNTKQKRLPKFACFHKRSGSSFSIGLIAQRDASFMLCFREPQIINAKRTLWHNPVNKMGYITSCCQKKRFSLSFNSAFWWWYGLRGVIPKKRSTWIELEIALTINSPPQHKTDFARKSSDLYFPAYEMREENVCTERRYLFCLSVQKLNLFSGPSFTMTAGSERNRKYVAIFSFQISTSFCAVGIFESQIHG